MLRKGTLRHWGLVTGGSAEMGLESLSGNLKPLFNARHDQKAPHEKGTASRDGAFGNLKETCTAYDQSEKNLYRNNHILLLF